MLTRVSSLIEALSLCFRDGDTAFLFVFLSATLTYIHLRMVGAKNLLNIKDFLPARKSYRYTRKTQPLMKKRYFFTVHVRSAIFWMFNCTRYCPYSVALFHWHTYLVKVVENFWCPFEHDKKKSYAEGAIDKSYWHQLKEDEAKMHPDDRINPIWNKNTSKPKKKV